VAEQEVSENVQNAITTAMDLGASPEAVLSVTNDIADLFRAAVIPMSFDREKMRYAMDLAVIGLLHERGLIP